MENKMSIEERLDRLESQEEIRSRIHDYCSAADRRDRVLMKNSYWNDATDDHGGFSGTGHDVCDYAIDQLLKAHTSIHAITNTRFEFKEDQCFTESQVRVLHRIERNDNVPGFYDYQHCGRYLDVFERRDGVWKILRRKFIIDADSMQKEYSIPFLVMKEMAKALGVEEVKITEEKPMYGSASAKDPVYKTFDLEQTMSIERGNPQDLWAPFYAIAPTIADDTATLTEK